MLPLYSNPKYALQVDYGSLVDALLMEILIYTRAIAGLFDYSGNYEYHGADLSLGVSAHNGFAGDWHITAHSCNCTMAANSLSNIFENSKFLNKENRKPIMEFL